VSAPAPAKINLALVVGPLRPDGKHEVVTVMQSLALADRVAVAPADRLSVTGFDDTLVTTALSALAAAAGVAPRWAVTLGKQVPVAAGLGGGSADAATALLLANATLAVPLPPERLAAVAAGVGADVPFFLRGGTQLASGDGTVLEPVPLPRDYAVLLVLPRGAVKESTADVYRRFDERGGPDGFEGRRAELDAALARVRRPQDLARLPHNDLASSPLAARLRALGAFRADVTGAGPCVYGLFLDRGRAAAAAAALAPEGPTWLTAPTPDAGEPSRPARERLP
jgi:4-diphosphocytidyl-2-C-methyl-D-erythritol kinase